MNARLEENEETVKSTPQDHSSRVGYLNNINVIRYKVVQSDLIRNSGAFTQWISRFVFSPTPMGAINQLYAGTSQKLTKTDSGKYFIPWAREGKLAKDLQEPELADKLWKFLEEDTAGKY